MKKTKALIPLALVTLLTGCTNGEYLHLRKFVTTEQGFQDLGDYVIQLDEYKTSDFEAARSYMEEKYNMSSWKCSGF